MAKSYTSKEGIDRAVLERDHACLTDLIRDPDLSPEIREHLADGIFGLLAGKTKRPPHRPKQSATSRKAAEIGERVWRLYRFEGWKKVTAAVRRVSEELAVRKRKYGMPGGALTA